MLKLSIKESEYDRRAEKRDWVVIVNTIGWGRFYAATPELKKRTVVVAHPHPDFKGHR
jgi:alpha/beta superfamily hydrolase